MKRIRIVLISVGILLGVLALGGIGVAAVNIYQQLNATPDHPPAARPMIPSAPPEADEKKAAQWGDMLRTHAAGADYTMNDAADLDEGWRSAAAEVTSISSNEVVRHVVIRTALEPDDRAAAGQIATVFSLWQQSGADVGELAPPGAGWVQPGTGGAVSVYATDSSLLLANVEF